MENIFFKYGIIIIGAVVIVLLISFSFNALKETIHLPEDKKESIIGEKITVIIELEELCMKCLKDKVDKDCYIKNIKTDEIITESDLTGDIVMPEDLSKGKNVVKIKSQNNICGIIKLD
ncbi:hypothetical protein GF327_03315 [Candidatus Woesearchaeota archaeon]|nr:hypothetical protein [Candidatus Woesearchaeota archaeon]